jgi:hypothetical protein
MSSPIFGSGFKSSIRATLDVESRHFRNTGNHIDRWKAYETGWIKKEAFLSETIWAE